MKMKSNILVALLALTCHGCGVRTDEPEMRIGCFADKVDVPLQPVLTPERACAILQSIDSRFTFRSGYAGTNSGNHVLVGSVIADGVKILANVWSCPDISNEIANVQVTLSTEENSETFVSANMCERYIHTFMQMSFSNTTPVWESLLRQNDLWDEAFARIREQDIQTPNYVLSLRRDGSPEAREYRKIHFTITSQWYQEIMNERLRKRMIKRET